MSKKPIFESVLGILVRTLRHSEPAMMVDLEPKPIKIYRILANPIFALSQSLWLHFELVDIKTKEAVEIGRLPFAITYTGPPTALVIDKHHPVYRKMPLFIPSECAMRISIKGDALKDEHCAVTLYVDARHVS